MSCRTWNELILLGERLLREGSEERRAAERHILSCPSCAERAFLLDPSFAVRRGERLDRTLDARGESRGGGHEVADLKRKILEARRMRRFEGSVHRAPTAVRLAATVALVAVFVAGGALFRTLGQLRPASNPELATAAVNESAAVVPTRLPEPMLFTGAEPDLSVPAVAALAPTAARVYDLGQEDFTLVMVVHETLDI